MGKAKFWPPGAPKPQNGFRWNLEYIIGSRVCPHMQIDVALRQRGWSGWTRVKTRVVVFRYTFFKIFLLYFSARAEPANVYRFWRSIYVIRRVSAQGYAFWWSRSYCSPFWGQNPPKTPILGSWIGIFRLNVQNIKIFILSKLLHR